MTYLVRKNAGRGKTYNWFKESYIFPTISDESLYFEK